MTPTSSRGGSIEAAAEHGPPVTTDEARAPRAGPEMSANELRWKTMSIIDEYLCVNDLMVFNVTVLVSLSRPFLVL